MILIKPFISTWNFESNTRSPGSAASLRHFFHPHPSRRRCARSLRRSQPLPLFPSPGTQFFPNVLLHLLLLWPGTTPTILLRLNGPSAARWTGSSRRTSWASFRGGWAACRRRAPASRCCRQSDGGAPAQNDPAGVCLRGGPWDRVHDPYLMMSDNR